MGLFGGQLANVVEWEEYRDDMIFWKWTNKEIKKGSKLIIRAGQNAIFLYNGKVEGIFKEEGSFDIESEIIPFLSSLKGFKFGFNSGMRAEVLFVNTKELTVKWGTRNPVSIPTPSLPGGMPIRSFGSFVFKVSDYMALIDKIAGVKQMYTLDDIRERVIANLDPLLMKWISQEGKDMFNLQANALQIAAGIRTDLDMQLQSMGFSVTDFMISSFSYPEEVQKMQEKVASQSMVGNMDNYTRMAMADSMGKGGTSSLAGDMVGIQMGMQAGQKMMQEMNQAGGQNTAAQGNSAQNNAAQGNTTVPKFCPDCGTPTNGAKFCSNCGRKLI